MNREPWMDVLTFSEDGTDDLLNNIVYIEYEGREYRICNQVGAEMLIDATEPQASKRERLQHLDIKGLGLLRFDRRSVSVTSGKRLVYRMKFVSV